MKTEKDQLLRDNQIRKIANKNLSLLVLLLLKNGCKKDTGITAGFVVAVYGMGLVGSVFSESIKGLGRLCLLWH